MAVEGGRQRSRSRGGGGRRASPRRKRGWRLGREVRVLLLITLVCAVTALGLSIITSTSFETILNLVVYRTTDPYLSPQQKQDFDQDFRERMKKELGGDLNRLRRGIR